MKETLTSLDDPALGANDVGRPGAGRLWSKGHVNVRIRLAQGRGSFVGPFEKALAAALTAPLPELLLRRSLAEAALLRRLRGEATERALGSADLASAGHVDALTHGDPSIRRGKTLKNSSRRLRAVDHLDTVVIVYYLVILYNINILIY